MNPRLLWGSILSALALYSQPAIAQSKPDKATRQAMTMTVEQIANSVDIKGVEQLDPILWVSTYPFLYSRFGADKFLRAMIDKTTGDVVYQYYVILQNRDWFRPKSMTYLSNGALKRVDMAFVDSDVDCSRYGCTHTEHAVANIDRQDLEQFAECAAPGSAASFTVKIFGSTVGGQESKMLCTEAAGLLLAVDTYLNARQAAISGEE